MPKITLEVSDKVYAWLVKESELTGYTVEAIVVRWVESGQLNAGPLLRLKCHRTACNNGKPTWWNQSTREYYCQACAHKINEANPDWQGTRPLCYNSEELFRGQL